MTKHKKLKRNNKVHEIKQEIEVSSSNHVTHNISFNNQPFNGVYSNFSFEDKGGNK